MDIKVGDTVSYQGTVDSMVGKTGLVIVAQRHGGSIIVQFPFVTPAGNHYWSADRDKWRLTNPCHYGQYLLDLGV